MLQTRHFLDWLSVACFCFPFFIVAKALTLDWKPRVKEFAFISLASLATASIILVNRSLLDLFTSVLGDLTLIALVVVYLHKIKSYPIKKAFPLMLLSCIIIIAAELTLAFFLYLFRLPIPPVFSTSFTDAFPIHITLSQLFRFMLPLYVFIASFTFTLLKLTKEMRLIIKRNPYLQSIIMLFSFYCVIFFVIAENIWRTIVPPADKLVTPQIPLVFIFTCILFVAFNFYTITIYIKHEKQQKDMEQQNLQHYADNLEQQQVGILKFKHDYQNILLSMQSFIQTDDLAGLKQFYPLTVKASALIAPESHSTFNYLHRIKPQEIKSILTAKLIQAQNMSENVHAIFEANDTIDIFPIDSVTLVRMLGIILDNAIEALAEIRTQGTLFISCLRWESGITFIVENTCPHDLPPMNLLWQPNFSTKGAKRGYGLPILSELVNAHPNVSLDTTVENSIFRQALLIETMSN